MCVSYKAFVPLLLCSFMLGCKANENTPKLSDIPSEPIKIEVTKEDLEKEFQEDRNKNNKRQEELEEE